VELIQMAAASTLEEAATTFRTSIETMEKKGRNAGPCLGPLAFAAGWMPARQQKAASGAFVTAYSRWGQIIG
jgi:hypothetical protein